MKFINMLMALVAIIMLSIATCGVLAPDMAISWFNLSHDNITLLSLVLLCVAALGLFALMSQDDKKKMLFSVATMFFWPYGTIVGAIMLIALLIVKTKSKNIDTDTGVAMPLPTETNEQEEKVIYRAHYGDSSSIDFGGDSGGGDGGGGGE